MRELVECFLENKGEAKVSPLSLDIQTPCAKSDFPFLFRPGEVTVWAGESGVGLSTLLGQIILALANQGQKVCITSGETMRYSLFLRLIQQRTGLPPNQFTEAIVNDFYENYGDLIELEEFRGARAWLRDNMIIVYDIINTPCKEDHGANHYFVESLETHLAPVNRYELQEFMFNLNSIAKKQGIHIHIACHIHPRVNKTDSDAIYVKESMKDLGPLCELASNVFLFTDRDPLASYGFLTDLRRLILCKQRNAICNIDFLFKMNRKSLTFQLSQISTLF